MRVFVTAPGGYVGGAISRELLAHGHDVFGLAETEADVAALQDAAVDARLGSAEDLDALRAAASQADGVIHEAALRVRPGVDFPAACGIETRAVQALGEGLAGSGKPFVVTSGVGLVAPDRDGLAHEQSALDPLSPAALRAPTEQAAKAVAAAGARASILRFAWSVHGDEGREGFLPGLVAVARSSGVSAYIDEGTNRWSAVHVRDLARLYRLALESAPAGAVLHAVAEEGVRLCQIAEAIGRRLELPVVRIEAAEARNHFGWLAPFAQNDAAASSDETRALLGWQPAGPGLLADAESQLLPD